MATRNVRNVMHMTANKKITNNDRKSNKLGSRWLVWEVMML